MYAGITDVDWSPLLTWKDLEAIFDRTRPAIMPRLSIWGGDIRTKKFIDRFTLDVARLPVDWKERLKNAGLA